MIDRLRHILLLLGGLTVLVGASTPPALAAGPCGGPIYSALNQYCETIPTAKGGEAPAVGAPSVATSLPGAVVTRIQQRASVGGAAHRAATRRLLSLPAPPAPPVQRAVISGGSGFPLWLSLVMAASAIALILAAAKRRWGRRGESGG